MNEFFNRIRFQLNQYLSHLTKQQKAVLAIVVAAALALLIVLLVWTNSRPYDPLYSDLSQKDAAIIVEKLKERQVDYKLENGGRTITVPPERVYELRLEFARDGLPEAGPVGYEIFDNQELGVTEFRQQVAYKRALEGELARTIASIEQVEKASVFIVIPKERLFERDQKRPTSSVQLKLKKRSMPRRMTIEAIAHLVASSIEGLEPENVTITDTRGRILSETRDPNDFLAQSSTRLEFKRKIETDLSQKALEVLEKRVGPGNATVQVTAHLDWSQVEKTIHEVDPDRSVPVSEEIIEESTPVSGEGGNAGTSESSNTITNYENSKTIQRIVEAPGTIRQLSIAVMVNNSEVTTTNPDGKQMVSYEPRSPQEIRQLERLVKSSVGFSNQRNDQFSIVNMEFNVPRENEDFVSPDSPWGDYYDILEKVFILLAIVASRFFFSAPSFFKSNIATNNYKPNCGKSRGVPNNPALWEKAVKEVSINLVAVNQMMRMK